jgi:hypothetical protein
VGHHAERGVVVEAPPGASFEVVEADFTFHFLVITLHPPEQFRRIGRTGGQLGVEGGSSNAIWIDNLKLELDGCSC